MNLIKPMEPILSHSIINSADWIHQIKWDGIRAITYIQDNNIRIFSKRNYERTGFYPEINEITFLLKGSEAIIDGEIVVFDEDSRPSFNLCLARDRVKNKKLLKTYMKKYPIRYIIFDILSFNNENLCHRPLSERRRVLENHFTNNPIISITDDFSDGKALYHLMENKNYEGIVSKNLESPYISGKKHDQWFKIKITKKMLAVIGGIKMKDNMPRSLMLGIFRDDKLDYIGNVISGLTQEDIRLIKEYMEYFTITNNPFNNMIVNNQGLIFLKPQLTCWVEFMEWTHHGHLRHPRIIGFSQDSIQKADGKEFSSEKYYQN